MPTFKVRIKRNYSPLMQRKLAGAIEKTLNEIGDSVIAHIKETVPIDTGALRDSYIKDVEPETRTLHVGSPLEYSSYVELGTGPNYEAPPDWIINNEKRGHHDTDPWWYFDEDDGEWKLGWFVRAQPHLAPAFLQHVNEYKNILKENLENA